MVTSSGEPSITVDLSVVVPVYRTAWALPELARRVRAVAEAEGLRHELVVVDDASPDAAREEAARLASEDPALRYLATEENLGQHRAVLVGLAAAQGEWVVVMDADLQDPPEAIPALLREAREGYDAVFAARSGRYQSRARMLTSRLFKRALARSAGVPAGSGMYFLASRRLVSRIVPCDDPRPFVVALVGLAGLPMSSVPVERAARRQGSSAYSAWRRLRAGIAALCFVRRRRAGAGPPPRATDPATPWRLLVPLALGAALVAVLPAVARGRGHAFELGDEGLRYLLSRSWADGAGLFQRFRLQYVPGQYVYYGAFLRHFGHGVETLRLADALLGGAAVAVLSATVGRLARLPLAAVAAAAAALLVFPGHATVASALVLGLAVDLAVRRSVGGRWVLGAAVLAGALAGWREDSAVLLMAVIGVAVALRRRPWDLLRLVLPGALLGLSAWVAVFALRGEGLELVAHVARRVLFLAQRLGAPTHPRWRFPPDPFASWHALATAAFPVVAAAIPTGYLALLVREGVRFRRTGAVRWPVVTAALVGLAYLPQFLWERPDLPHLRAHLHLALAVAAIGAATLRPIPRRVAVAGFVGLAAFAALRAGPFREREAPELLYPCCEGARIGARVPPPSPPWAGFVSGGEAAPARGAGSLVVLGWGPGWYVLEGTRPGTRFLYTGERGLDDAEVAELAADLAAPTVRWVLARPHGTPYAEPLRVLEELYEPRDEWRRWRLWERRSSSPPDASPGSS